MKHLLAIMAYLTLVSCNNSKKNSEEVKTTEPTTTTTTNTEQKNPTGNGSTIVTIDGKDIPLSGSLLVSKDKDKLQPGADYLAMLTASGGSNSESLTLNFLLALKPGTYPVVGTSFLRGPSENSEVYGGLLGGKPKITDYKVTLTDVKDLGSNNIGGHKWSISGSFDPMTIPAMSIMLLDETKKHPKEIKLDKVVFTNLTFDDNWEEAMEKAMEQMKVK
jgi:hypothetical protein